MNDLKQFTVVLRGPSAAVFGEDEGIAVSESNPTVGQVRISLQTRWLSPVAGVKMPGHIWIEAIGSATSIETAIEQFSRSALAFVPLVSLAANAAIEDCELELAFDSTPGVSERDYFQSHIPREGSVPRQGRRVEPQATVKLFEAVQRSQHRERLLRAINQYWLALHEWRLGYESMAVVHLWMAAEALTKAVVRSELERRGFSTESELAAGLGIDLKKLDSTVRRELIFDGDRECYDDGKVASDGLEHGYLAFDEIRNRSAAIRSRMATLVRNAIFDLVALDPEAAVLRATPYDEPLGNWPLARYVRGKLVGTGEQLAAPGNAYPICVWTVSVNTATPAVDGRTNAQFTEIDDLPTRPRHHLPTDEA